MNRNNTLAWGVFAIGSAVFITAAAIYISKNIKKQGKPTKFKKSLIANAVKHLDIWQKGKVKEGDSKTMDYLRSYWDAVGLSGWSDSKKVNEAWSAAFISKMMKDSGAGDKFAYSPSHSTYIVQSIKNRKENNNNPFKGYKPDEVKVEVGDLVCYSRQSGVTYDTTGSYASHCDLVAEINGNTANSIGGNVSNSVSLTPVELDENGYLKRKDKYFVVIKNNL